MRLPILIAALQLPARLPFRPKEKAPPERGQEVTPQQGDTISDGTRAPRPPEGLVTRRIRAPSHPKPEPPSREPKVR